MSTGPDIPEAKTVPVRLGVALAVTGAAVTLLALVVLLMATSDWLAFGLTIAAAGLAAAGLTVGILGTFRHGIFSEGQGARELGRDRRRAGSARLAGVIGEVVLLLSVVLAVVALVKAIVGG